MVPIQIKELVWNFIFLSDEIINYKTMYSVFGSWRMKGEHVLENLKNSVGTVIAQVDKAYSNIVT